MAPFKAVVVEPSRPKHGQDSTAPPPQLKSSREARLKDDWSRLEETEADADARVHKVLETMVLEPFDAFVKGPLAGVLVCSSLHASK